MGERAWPGRWSGNRDATGSVDGDRALDIAGAEYDLARAQRALARGITADTAQRIAGLIELSSKVKVQRTRAMVFPAGAAFRLSR
jgi:hypothetical protein